MAVKSSFGRHLDKIYRTEWRHEKEAWLLSNVQYGGNDVQILGFLGDDFPKENLHFRSWNFFDLVQGF